MGKADVWFWAFAGVFGVLIVSKCLIAFSTPAAQHDKTDPAPLLCFAPFSVTCKGPFHTGDRGMSVRACSLDGRIVDILCSNGMCCAFPAGQFN
jgi:hypothetical protein